MKRNRFFRACAALTAACVALMTAGAPALASGLLEWLTGANQAGQDDAISLPDLRPTPTEIADAAPTPGPSDAGNEPEIPGASILDDGQLRVLLRSLGTEEINVTVAGSYALDGDAGFRFDRGAALRLAAADGAVYLSAGGVTVNLGPSATLTRHAAPEGMENGLYIAESEKRALYAGDLSLWAEGDALRAVLVIGVEDYLYGVVGYEMSDAFPLEALKAQAVAARTYAMQRKWSAAGRDYDVVDTTADQVFKGYDPSFTNVVAAVDATRGVVGIYDGGFAVCYYTASNGGQTALASQIWGGTGSDGYLAMRDDPYDLENPRSLQNELTISTRCEGSATLRAMLEEALAPKMEEAGFMRDFWRFGTIEAITPVEPRFEGSRMYDGVAFELRPQVCERMETTPAVTLPPEMNGPTGEPAPTPTAAPEDAPTPAPTAEPTPTATPPFYGEITFPPSPTTPIRYIDLWRDSEATYTVVLKTYDDIKDRLGLGLNSGDYELFEALALRDEMDAPSGFTLVMRRFGHGVGMSQRGAQWMAGHYAMGWRDILEFYYPGLSVEHVNWPATPLTALEALPAGVGAARPTATPRPTPAPLPEAKPGEIYAVVALESAASTLNVRAMPSTQAMVLDRLENGRRVIISGPEDGEGWVPIYTAEVAGYVKAQYLAPEE